MSEASKTVIPENRNLRAENANLFLAIILQLAAVVGAIYLYDLEKPLRLLEITCIAGLGYVINWLVPIRWKLAYFIALTFAAAIYLVGWLDGGLIIGYGIIMVLAASGIRNLRMRYAIILLLFGILIALTASGIEWVRNHFVVFTVLGSMFMFRLSLFLYEKHHQTTKRQGILNDIAYFFMLPNMAISLFPVVDYQTFSKPTPSAEQLKVFKKGIQWMVLGVFHLVVYRFIYFYLHIPNQEVTDVWTLGHYAVTNYLLIIRLSGIYHFSVGMLCLFGFNLPTVFNNYFLASGFSDLWRRINIYYRDYVLKVFYYPLFFQFRKYGMVRGQVVSILIIFIITWLLHSFQWFWLKGKFPLRLVDVIYWGVFGILVAANVVIELKNRGKNADISPWKNAVTESGKIILMFLFMSVLWSLWSARSLPEWVVTMGSAFNANAMDIAGITLILSAIWIVSIGIYYLFKKKELGSFFNPEPESKMASIWSLLMLAGLLGAHAPVVKTAAMKSLGWDMTGLLTPKLTDADEHLMIEGYYEEILIGNELTNPVGDLQEKRKLRFKETEAAELVEDIRNTINKPNVQTLFKEKKYTTNKWGMRDRNYELKPDPNTIRMGFVGGSFVVGSGVADEEVFDEVLENNMNSIATATKYEFLNFSNSGYDLIQCIYHFEKQKHHQFDLDYLVYVSHGVDIHKNLKSVLSCFNSGFVMPYPYLQEMIERSGIRRNMPENQQLKMLEPFGKEMLENMYGQFVELCNEHKIQPVWLYWPTISSFIDQSEYLHELAKKSGFEVINLESVFDNYEPASLIVSMSDRHPNALGHKIVAEALEKYFSDSMPIQKQSNNININK